MQMKGDPDFNEWSVAVVGTAPTTRSAGVSRVRWSRAVLSRGEETGRERRWEKLRWRGQHQ
jgi:hypothetical protein